MEFEEKTLKRELKFKGHIFDVAVMKFSYQTVRQLAGN